MLNAMRSKVGGYIAKTLMLLLVVAFAVWGVGDMVNVNLSGGTVAAVGGEKISLAEFQRNVRQFTRSLEAQRMSQPDARLVQRQVLRRLIEERLIKLALRDAGLAAGRDQLIDELRTMPVFQNPDGTFNETLFVATLRQRQQSEDAFLTQLQNETEIETLISSIGADELLISDAYLALSARAANQTRDVMLISIPVSASAAPDPTDQQMKEFYDQQKELLFVQPEQRSLEYATFSAADLQALVKKAAGGVTRDEAMQDITYKLEDALAAGKSLRDALKETGLNAQPRILTQVTAGSGKDAITQAVIAQGFKLGEGETSNLEVAEGGTYYVVSVAGITPAAPKPFETVKDEVKRQLQDASKRNTVRIRADMLMGELKEKDADWKALITEQRLEAKPVTGVRRTGTSALPEPMQQAIFEQPVGSIVGPLIMGDGNAMVAIITGVQQGKSTTLDEAARTALTNEITQEIIGQYFNTLAERYAVTINDKLFNQLQQQSAVQ